MAHAFSSSYISCAFVLIYMFSFLSDTEGILENIRPSPAFQPSNALVTQSSLTTFLLGNVTDISLNLRTSSPSSTTGKLPPPSCAAESTQWLLTSEPVGKSALQIQLRLNRSLHLCGDNQTDTDCCSQPLCVLETLQLTACLKGKPQASMLIQARIFAFLFPTNLGSEHHTVIPNQVFQPLGACPCDLSPGACDIRCCCDKDCSPEDLKLFDSHCLPGPFGGHVSAIPDYQCSAGATGNVPDWFPFLCVMSPAENNPYLGLFYQGKTIVPKPAPSFQRPLLSAPLPTNEYRHGSPIFTLSDEYFIIPQNFLLGQCANNAPVAYLRNFNIKCVTSLNSCPNAPPLQTTPSDLSVQVKDGQGGLITVDVVDEVVFDLSKYVESTASINSPVGNGQVCSNVTLAMNYTFYWQGNGLTQITVTRTVGTFTLKSNVVVVARYSATFLNGLSTGESWSGSPGYQVGRPVIAGMVNTLGNDVRFLERTSLNIWQPVSDGLCSSAPMTPVLFGKNATSGCLLPISLYNLTQCTLLRETVAALQAALVPAKHVATIGNPDFQSLRDWVEIRFPEAKDSNTPMENTSGLCFGIPSHQHIHVSSFTAGVIGGVPQREIYAVHVSYTHSTWSFECGGGESLDCPDVGETQSFAVTSSVTFTDFPVYSGPPKTRFQINFTEYDCDRNDVCWPELAFPITRYYTGEPYSQSLAKGLILVFCFIAASVLGNPWRQIRQVWSSVFL